MATPPHPRRRHVRHPKTPTASTPPTAAPSSPDNSTAHPTDGPQFAQPVPSPDPGSFTVTHPSDNAAYKILDSEQRAGELGPMAFPAARGGPEPILTLEQVLGPFAHKRLGEIAAAKMLVFHSVGDTGNLRNVTPQNQVSD